MVNQPPERQPPMAIAMQWVSQITTGGFLLALPAVGGWWLDGKLKSGPWCLVVGGFVGMVLSLIHIFTITGVMKSAPKRK